VILLLLYIFVDIIMLLIIRNLTQLFTIPFMIYHYIRAILSVVRLIAVRNVLFVDMNTTLSLSFCIELSTVPTYN
jgi:hypothetical protein